MLTGLTMNKNSSKPILFLALLFVISVIYFAGFGNAVFFYQENRSLFIFSGAYLREFLLIPGGLTEYMGNFISQWYYSSLYGSLVLSVFPVLFAIALFRIYEVLTTHKPVWIILIIAPSCLLLVLQVRIDHFIHHSLGYLLLALFTWLSIHLSRKGLSILVPLLFPAFVHLTGSFALIFPAIFTIYCLVHIQGKSRYILPVILFIIALLSLTGFEGILLNHPPEKYLGFPLNFMYPENLHKGDIILCTYLILFPLLVRAAGSIKITTKFSRLALHGISYIAFLISVIILGALHDPDFAKRSRIEKFFVHREWDKVIAQHEKDPSKHISGPYYYNLALSEKGQLCERMFHGRQDFGEESLLIRSNQEYIDRPMYYYYTLGFINEAHHLAYESMVLNGYRPENIKMLIKCDLINGNYRSAIRYIDILKKTLHYRQWAKKHELMLHRPDLMLSDPGLGAKIKLLPRKDFFISPSDALNIDLMLWSNPENKIALEYKLASLLLEKDYKAIVYQVKKMKNMAYDSLPRHIEEAITLFIKQDHELPYLGDFELSPGLRNSFDQYAAATKENPGTATIENSWGTTYWYYFEFQ